MNKGNLPPRPLERRSIARKLTPAEELHTLIRGWRLRIDPRHVPELQRPGQRRRKKMSQAQVADLAGVSLAWYSRLERGDPANHSEEVLNRVADALRLADEERAVMHLLVAAFDTTRRDGQQFHRADLDAICDLIDHIPWPAWLSDPAWDVVAVNAEARRWFPHLSYESNVMRWVWCHPQARTTLVDWDGVWAPRMLAQLRMANARWPDNTRLKEIITEVLATSTDARSAWERQPTLQAYVGSDWRQLHVPFQAEPVLVELVALTPVRDSDLRVVVHVPRSPVAEAVSDAAGGH